VNPDIPLSFNDIARRRLAQLHQPLLVDRLTGSAPCVKLDELRWAREASGMRGQDPFFSSHLQARW
ncbi:MAG: hypothetical protein ACM31O_10455, partial [Bacteroidota bacterium]